MQRVFELAHVARPTIGMSARCASPESGRSASPLISEYFLMKYWANSVMSAGRSRKGGILQVDHVEAE